MNFFSHQPQPWHDQECKKCEEEKVKLYTEKHPNWSPSERAKYARSKCPCKNKPCKLEPAWVHWVTVLILIAALLYFVKSIF